MITDAEDAGDDALVEELQARRTVMMDASFLRASLFTFVVSFGVSALMVGVGVVLACVGVALVKLAPRQARTD